MLRVRLPFTTIECSRCEAQRQARFACSDCGKAPAVTEVDLHVEGRQRALSDVGDRRALAQRLEVNVLDLWDTYDLVGVLTRMIEAWNAVAEDPRRRAPALRKAAAEVASLERWAAEVEPLRPLIMPTRHTRGLIEAIAEVYELLEAGFREEQMEQAQQMAHSFQSTLDAVEGEVLRVGELVGRASRVLESPDPLAAWVRESIGSSDLETAVERGRELVQAHLGRQAEAGSAFVASLSHTLVSPLGDSDEFWRLASDHLARLEGADSRVLGVVGEPLFSARLAEVAEDLWDAARRATVSPEPVSLRAGAREILEAGHLITEQALKFHLGLLCAAKSRNSFSETQAGDVSVLLNVASGQAWGVASALGDSAMRNAFAHRDFAIVGNEVSLSPRHRQHEGTPELLVGLDAMQDSVLRFVEAAAAMNLALAIFLEARGIEVETASLERFLAVAFLSAMGWSDVDVDHDGKRVVVAATASNDVDDKALTFVVQPFLDSADDLELKLARVDTGERCVVQIDLRRHRDWRSAVTEDEKQVTFALLRRFTLVDGEPLLTDEHIERIAANRGWEALMDASIPTRQLVELIRTLQRLAQEVGLMAVDRELVKCLRLRLQAGSGLPLNPAEFEPLDAMAHRMVPGIRCLLL